MPLLPRQVPLLPPWPDREWRTRFAVDLPQDDEFRAYVEAWVEWCGKNPAEESGRINARMPASLPELRSFVSQVHGRIVLASSPRHAFREVVSAMRLVGGGLEQAPGDLRRPLCEVMAHFSDTLDQLALAALAEHYGFTPWGPQHRCNPAKV